MNTISEGRDTLDRTDRGSTLEQRPGRSVDELRAEIAMAIDVRTSRLHADADTEAGPRGQAIRSTIETRSSLRAAAVAELGRDGGPAQAVLQVGTPSARDWADLDAAEFQRMRSPARKDTALNAIAANIRQSPDYSEALTSRSAALTTAAGRLNESLFAEEGLRAQQQASARRLSADVQRTADLLATFDALALQRLARIRAEESIALAATLRRHEPQVIPAAPSPADPMLIPVKLNPVLVPATKLPSTAERPESTVAGADLSTRLIRRPILENEVPMALRGRYVITTEKGTLLDIGRTEFTFRGGARDGQPAFRDAGRRLQTSTADKEVIRAMVEIATTKGWKEISIAGSDEFRRSAWLEARLAGVKVNGFEPKEADLRRLAKLALEARPNVAHPKEQSDTVQTRPIAPTLPRSDGRTPDKAGLQVNGDALSANERGALDSMEQLLKGMKHSDAFIAATLHEVEARMRSQRVHMGEVLDHGKASYRFDEKNSPSYFVTLKTARGPETVWGKQLGAAMDDGQVKVGDQIVLTNTGKQPVDIRERVPDTQGAATLRWKAVDLNSWTAQPIDRLTVRDRQDLEERRQRGTPALQVYDLNAERSARVPVRPDAEPIKAEQEARWAPRERG